MEKITIIGLGLVGNSIGMALKRAYKDTGEAEVVGFDPDRNAETSALRTHLSIDSVAPDLERAVRGASLVIVSTPVAAAREVFAAIEPFLEEGATVTDTLPVKEPVMAWAGELLGSRASFVGGHPLSRAVDTETARRDEPPSADLFAKATYCIMPLPSASGAALNRVIAMAEALGAHPLFIDPVEHDSFFAAVSQLPSVAAAALARATLASPSWEDIGALAQEQFELSTRALATDPAALAESIATNRQALRYWLDQYLLALAEWRDLLAAGDTPATLRAFEAAHRDRERWLEHLAQSDEDDPLAGRRVEQDDQTRATIQQAMQDAHPARRLFGNYIANRVFGRKDDK